MAISLLPVCFYKKTICLIICDCIQTKLVLIYQCEMKSSSKIELITHYDVVPSNIKSSKNKCFKVLRLIIFIPLIFIFMQYYFAQDVVTSFQTEKWEILKYINKIKLGGCTIPDIDPFDPRIKKYIKKKWPLVSCGHVQYPLTYVDSNTILHINQSAVIAAKLSAKDLKCSYRKIIRLPNNDNKVKLDVAKDFKSPIQIKDNFIIVRCFEHSKLVYETGHAVVQDLDAKLSASSNAALERGAVNVLVLALDSMSRLNFIRQLPKSYQFIRNQLNATVMRGLTKNGINTYPNMLAMLTGLSRNEYEQKQKKTYFDGMPAAWKNFSSHGYVTMFGEDLPEYAIFNYLSQGFHKPPTHYYMRPFWLQMDKLKSLKSKDNRCYGHVPKFQFLWNYTEDFVMKMYENKSAFFAFSFMTDMSHNLLNSVQVLDDDLLQLLQRLRDSGVLNNTLLLVMGDHGQRIDKIRQTKIGRIEDSMPFLAVHLPPRLDQFREGLAANAQILTSWSDVYEMLMDVAMDNLVTQPKQVRYGKRGLSLLRAIPRNRTCSDLKIAAEYCVCTTDFELESKSKEAKVAGEAMIAHLNALLLPYEACAKLTLEHVTSAQRIILPESLKDANSGSLTRVTVRAKPSGALFEAMLQSTQWKNNQVLGEVSRINKYGNQSLCVESTLLRQYCYCQ